MNSETVRNYLRDLRNHPRRFMALRLSVGVVSSVICLLLGPRIAELARVRPGFVPVGMAVLLGGLLHPRVRHWFIISLCFSVSLLALKDTFRPAPLPPAIDHTVFHAVYPFVWLTVAMLAAAAGVLEALNPGGIAARRCYFATASLYFMGHGFTMFLWEANWEGLVVLLTGIVAGFGVGFAHRLDFSVDSSTLMEEGDIARAERRRAAIAAHEWRDHSEAKPIIE